MPMVAFAERTRDLDPAAGLMGEAVDLGQAEAGSSADRLGGEERIEDAAEHIARGCLRRYR